MSCEQVWEPIFSPDGKRLLIRSMREGKYYRQVIPVTGIVK